MRHTVLASTNYGKSARRVSPRWDSESR
jgi:hypothetical protein